MGVVIVYTTVVFVMLRIVVSVGESGGINTIIPTPILIYTQAVLIAVVRR